MTLNKEYITQLYDEIGADTREELGINSLEDFIDYIKATITSNLQDDLDLEIDGEKLFKAEMEINKN